MTDSPDDERLPGQRAARVGWAYQVARDAKRAEARFDAWAGDYDADVRDLCDWQGPAEAAKVVQRFLATDARILDAGAGTGLVGECLHRLGYKDMVATDLSREMLNVAEAKAVYRATIKADLMEPLSFDDDSFDGVLCIGTSGYVTGQVVAEFARITRPGGCIIFTVGDERYREGGFRKAVDGLCRDGRVDVVEVGPEFASLPRAHPEYKSRIHVLRRRGT